MGAGERIILNWPEKKPGYMTEHTVAEMATDLIYPMPLTEKTLFIPDIKERSLREQPVNRSFLGDNLEVMQKLLSEGYENSLDLIYIDPPYMSASNYHSKTVIKNLENNKLISRLAFTDVWNYDMKEYLTHIYHRLQLMYQLLKENGSIFVHLDWHCSHYVKVLLDEIFSPEAFINEIVWCYSGGSGAGRHFQRKHDVIFWYVKGKDYIFNPQYRPYTEGTIQRGLTRVKGDKYQLNEKGANLQDWWTDINKILSPTARENLKFPTQKPFGLIKRIIAAASDPGCLVADFYAGSGTTAAACEELDRQWICCDASSLAMDTMQNRLIRNQSRPFTLEMNADQLKMGNAILKIDVHKTQILQDEIEINLNIQEFIPEQGAPVRISSAALISFWEADLDYNGKNFCSDIQVLRKSRKFDNSLCRDILLRVPIRDTISIAVRVHDLWGNITTGSVMIPV